jgi:MFS family permease
MGFFLNSFSGIINAYVGDVLPSKLLGRAFGILFAFSFCVGALASYLMGLISDICSLSISMLFLGIISLVGAIVSIITPRNLAG